MNFVDELPPHANTKHAKIDVEALRANPGRWAEGARYPKTQANAAASRGRYFVSRHEGVEYTTRSVGDETILFVRAVAA